MIRKESEPDDGSLDLLLDTICNTFGGVLFISMLVVVLLNMTSDEVARTITSPESQASLANNRRDLDESKRKLQGIRQAVKDAGDLATLIADPELNGLLGRLRTEQGVRGNLEDKTTDEVGGLAKTRIETNELEKLLDDREKEAQEARKKLALADELLKKEIELRTRTSQLPTPKTMTRTQVLAFLSHGRLCFYAKVDGGGALVVNDDECKEEQENGKTFVVPKENAGIAVDPSGVNIQEIRKRLEEFDKQKHYLMILVRMDSFGHFSTVRSLIVAMGFEYSLAPIRDDEKAFIGSSQRNQIGF